MKIINLGLIQTINLGGDKTSINRKLKDLAETCCIDANIKSYLWAKIKGTKITLENVIGSIK